RVVYTSDHGDSVGTRGLWGKSTMYEGSVGVPLIVSGPGIPEGEVVTTSASLLDLYPFIMQTGGERTPETVTPCHPGLDITEIIAGRHSNRTVFSEYHGMGSRTAAYMIRKGPYKLVHYADYEPQLFDLSADPEELIDLASTENAKPILNDL